MNCLAEREDFQWSKLIMAFERRRNWNIAQFAEATRRSHELCRAMRIIKQRERRH